MNEDLLMTVSTSLIPVRVDHKMAKSVQRHFPQILAVGRRHTNLHDGRVDSLDRL